MSCEHWRKQIALYVEGDVSPRKSRQVGEHVGNCPDCRRFAQELTQTQAVLRSLRHEAIDGRVFETIQDRVMEQLASSQVSVSHGWPRSIAWRWTVTGFVALLVFVGGAIWKRSSHRMSTEIVETGKPEGRIAT